ncbi:MAG: bifunctional 2-polyprenyl-6-hydroxyphenol methylase/3-demethylubiquinol 3-O-methyltransferase UbiG, partial [Rhodospirillales bacterium]|nr:bifunctional 2-polyprenyl-6-hydroxyphenol methylase/3-demethylubiquinol 3-O-methyltransferase UbiG [Rhodospirillales bacterium]
MTASPSPTASAPAVSTASADEIARFAAIADEWWDATGKFKPLHKLNPVRVQFVRDCLAAHFDRDPIAANPLAGISLLDVGCGGGLMSEPLYRLGAELTSIDAGEVTIEVARNHAERNGLDIAYRQAAPEELAQQGLSFDTVMSLEVIEHVSDVEAFLAAIASLVKPGGALVIGTLNRTLKSLALAKIGAEYILRWLPAGTHDWKKFV